MNPIDIHAGRAHDVETPNTFFNAKGSMHNTWMKKRNTNTKQIERKEKTQIKYERRNKKKREQLV